MSTNPPSLEAPRDGTLWVVQVLGAILFFLAGFAKLSGDGQMIQTFTAAGIGQWFRCVTGIIEIASAILLLIPALCGIGALAAVPMTIGSVLINLPIVGGSPAPPIGLLVIASIVAWGRKETTLRLILAMNDLASAKEAAQVSKTFPPGKKMKSENPLEYS
jgi:putative oxidoreductase